MTSRKDFAHRPGNVPVLVVCGILYWIIGLVTIVLLWRRESSEYYSYADHYASMKGQFRAA